MTYEESQPTSAGEIRTTEHEAIGALATNTTTTLRVLEKMATPETAQVFNEVMLRDPSIQARPEQLECLDAIHATRQAGDSRALIQMATGLGKTNVVATDVKRFLQENPGSRVLFLCHQNDILRQARERFESIIGPDYSYGNLTGESKDFHEVTCLFASFQAMRNWREAFFENEFDYIAVDESHHGKADTYEPTLDYFNPQFMLGVTATPDRHDLRDIRDIFGDEIFSLPLEEAIIRGLLARVDYRVITDEILDTNVLSDLRGKKFKMSQLNRTIFVPKRDEEIVSIIAEKSKEIEHPKRLIFCKSIEHAEEIATHFASAAPLHSRQTNEQQDEIIELFKGEGLDTLVTVDMFNEGIDIPDANQIVFLRSTDSKTIFYQQLGRGLRRVAGKDEVQILDFVANCERLTLLHDMWKEIYGKSGGIGPDFPETFSIDVGEVHFTEVARQVLEVIAEVEAYSFSFRNWGEAESIHYYLDLKKKLGGVSPTRDYISDLGVVGEGPPLAVILRPFGGRVSNLRKAVGEFVMETRQYSKDELVDHMVEIMGRIGTPTPSGFNDELGMDITRQYKKYFGTFNNLVRQANLLWIERKKSSQPQEHNSE